MQVLPQAFLDKKLVLGLGLVGLVCITNTQVPILPTTTITFIYTFIIVWFISLCVTLFFLYKLLQRTDPLQLKVSTKCPLVRSKDELKPKPEKVEALVRDIDKYFISKWYRSVSKNEDFTSESVQLLEEIIKRLADVQLCVNNKLLLHGVLNIYLKHLKEFRRSLKRKQKYGGTIDEMYRYSHNHSNNSKRANDYFLQQLTTNLLRHFINSELWNSLPCTILVSILSRKLIGYLLKLISSPEILNFVILDSVASKAIREKYKLSEYSRICITQFYDVVDSKEKVDVLAEVMDFKETKLELAEVESEVVDTSAIPKEKEDIPISNSDKQEEVKLRKRNNGTVEPKDQTVFMKPILSDQVKIYEAKLTKSNRTWRDSKDLGLGISLGQDPLDAFPVTVESIKHTGKSTFWDTGKIEHFVEDSMLLNEMKHTTQTTMEGLKSSIKPISDATVHTLHNIKDLQESTMNNALHKIGDFQDEAAGMVEGILDFGRAGLRKGLRLTGLQDNIESARPQMKPQPKKRPLKMARVESSEKVSVAEEDIIDSVWMNPLQGDSPNFDGQILLEKSGKSEEREEKEFQIPSISMEQSQSDPNSPDPEYEDTADLASSIAKLRSLLQQRSSESSMSTPALSPMCLLAKHYGSKPSRVVDRVPFFSARPPDEFGGTKVTEVELTSDLDEADGVMPSFYKFCAKTATGVLDKTLNTIKTALPGQAQGVELSDNAWIFIQAEQSEADILTRMSKLLTERKEYCTLDTEIDTAYEAIDSLDGLPHPSYSPNVEFEDELDDFEVKLPITKVLIDVFCELLADTNTPLIQESVVKAVFLTLGNSIEKVIISFVDRKMQDFCTDLITIPEKSNQNTLNLDMDVYIEALLTSLPDSMKIAFGKSTLCQALNLFVSAMQVQRINQDVILQVFELISLKLIEESSQMTPPASA